MLSTGRRGAQPRRQGDLKEGGARSPSWERGGDLDRIEITNHGYNRGTWGKAHDQEKTERHLGSLRKIRGRRLED